MTDHTDDPTTDDDRTTDHAEDRTVDHSDDRRRTVEIPERTAQAIARRMRGTTFESVDEYVAFALGQLLRELDRQDDEDGPSTPPDAPDGPAGDDTDGGGSDPDDGATDEAVADRLESLGYL